MKIQLKKIGFAKLVILFCLAFMPFCMMALTPQEVLNRAKGKLSSASTLSADFTMKLSGQSVKGTIRSKGAKFALVSNASSNWYNGKSLYTYVSSQGETTVFNPSSSELADVNPLLYINSSSQFNVTGTKTKKAGIETVVLIPKKSGTGVKNVIIDLDASSFLPKTIRITPSSGGQVEISISNIKLNQKIADSSFEYPASKYKNTKIIDMR